MGAFLQVTSPGFILQPANPFSSTFGEDLDSTNLITQVEKRSPLIYKHLNVNSNVIQHDEMLIYMSKLSLK